MKKSEKNVEQITELNVYIEIKYLRMNQLQDRMITMWKAFFSLPFLYIQIEICI